MPKINKIFTFFTAFFALIIFIFLAFSVWSHARNSALQSCVFSASSDIAEHSKLIHNFAKSRDNFYILSDEEAQKVLAEISFKDCSFSNSQPKDIKERNLKIAVKKNSEHNSEIKVWSKGFDNISGTDDDIYGSSYEKPLQ